MKLLSCAVFLSAAATASGHCWPCSGQGEFLEDPETSFGKSGIRITQLGQCIRCCNYIIPNGYASQEPKSDEVFMHRDHCKEVHCQDWQKETEAGGSCDLQAYTAKAGTPLEGQTIMRAFCPKEHRCKCFGISGPASCVPGYDDTTGMFKGTDEAGWDQDGGDYGCRKGRCPKDPQTGKFLTTW